VWCALALGLNDGEEPPAAALQSNGIKPEFCKAISTLNMNMEWLMPITRIEKETIWPGSEYSWHVSWLAARRIE